jgi:prepilin-type N-terminal cleavage/methylation domain-containing protein
MTHQPSVINHPPFVETPEISEVRAPIMRALQTKARPSRQRRARRGFTLIELSIVILIIGIIVAFIAQASFLGTETARTRATQGLISKLEHGIAERLDSLMTQRIEVNGAHRYLASINPPGYTPGALPLPWGLPSEARAEAIARLDYIRMEMPDVFFIQNHAQYPVNFAALPYPSATGLADDDYLLPIGHMAFRYEPESYDTSTTPPTPIYTGTGDFPGPILARPQWVNRAKGVYGASFNARAALHKAIGYTARGTDGVDNDGNGMIDEYAEGIMAPDGSTDPDAVARIQRFLANHTHETARAELLYALVVNGSGPLGAIFNEQDFKRDVEVRDTDGDGLLEFVDGWGKPLQFYRWPIYYHRAEDGVQRGAAQFYQFDTRPNFPADPSRALVAPAWWSDLSGNEPLSPKSALVQRHFTSLIDPNIGGVDPDSNPPLLPLGPPNYWDRSGASARRAFDCKFLILSAGPDQEYGTYVVPDGTIRANINNPDANTTLLLGNPIPPSYPGNGSAWYPSVPGENWAILRNGYPVRTVPFIQYFVPGATEPPVAPPDAANDDVTNRNIQAPTGGIR